MQLGPNITVIDRHQRPNVLNRVLLRTFFINDGQLQDPYQLSAVNIFPVAAGTSASGYLNSLNLVDPAKVSESKMVFQPSSTGIVRNAAGGLSEQFYLTNYTGALGNGPEVTPLDPSGQPCSGVSGVYRVGDGEFAVVLDGILGGSLSGVTQDPATPPGAYGNIQNSASAATTYADVWTVKLTANSSWKTYINYFELYDGAFYTTTQPLLLTTKNDLTTKRVTMGSVVNLKVTTDITVGNRAIDSSIKNLMKNAALYDPEFKVMKVDQQSHSKPSRVVIVGFDTIQDIDITSENTLLLKFDTNSLLDINAPSDLTTPIGTYAVQVRYKLMNETIVSPLMYFTVS